MASCSYSKSIISLVSDPNYTFLQFSLTPEKIGLVFLSNSVLYILVAPFAGKIADKIVSETLCYTIWCVCVCVCDCGVWVLCVYTCVCLPEFSCSSSMPFYQIHSQAFYISQLLFLHSKSTNGCNINTWKIEGLHGNM